MSAPSPPDPVDSRHPGAPPIVTDVRPRSLGIVWEGSQRSLHSFATVNREICLQLLARGHELMLLPTDALAPAEPALPLPAPLAARVNHALPVRPDIHVRHQWPPRFAPPPASHWIMLQPWEYGSLPRVWLAPMTDQVDEVWVYTRYLRDCYLRSGLPAERVHVIPLGVDPGRFHPQAPPLSLATGKRFRFLFVGGTIQRKGIDVLLTAYARAFTAADDVCLVVKELGGGTFYRGQTAQEAIAHLRARPGMAALEYLDLPLTPDELPGLYTACDCLVHPYRGEGFGLPIAEAMACGLPVIVTGYGAALDFCDDSNAYLLPVRLGRFREKRIGDLETVDYPWLAEPDVDRLVQALRYVVEHREEARSRGRAGQARIHAHFTWAHTAAAIERRAIALREQPLRRHREVKATVPVAPPGRPTVSLCMIVRNEEATLGACLASVAGLVDEMVVVDTGSTDGTRAVASRAGARLVGFAWVDDFSAARNESIRHAIGDWVFWLDADERLDADNRRKVGELFAGLGQDRAAYLMRQLSPTEDPHGTQLAVDQVRLFRRDPAVRWRYRVHEQILLALRAAGHEVRRTDIVIAHAGYEDREQSGRKLQRNQALLEREIAERPDDAIPLYQLGVVYQQLGRLAEALPLLQRSLDLAPADYSIRPRLYAVLARGHQRLGQRAEARAVCRLGRERHPDHTELLFLEATLFHEEGDSSAAEACLLLLLREAPRDELSSGDAGLRTYRARHLLGEVYKRQGRWAEAEAQWRAAVGEQSRFVPAWQELAALYRLQGRAPELADVVRQLDRLRPGRDRPPAS
jgi:glycosyltransferase involved in cell wall biosynthesis/tetratricopeptide (TPR) repeat protein